MHHGDVLRLDTNVSFIYTFGKGTAEVHNGYTITMLITMIHRAKR